MATQAPTKAITHTPAGPAVKKKAAAPTASSAPVKAARAVAPLAPSANTPEKKTKSNGSSPAVRAGKQPKLSEPKPVRDSFTMPKAEYQLIHLLKQRAAAKDHKVKKSELLRAGVMALADMSDARLLAAIKAVPVIKTGRPRNPSGDAEMAGSGNTRSAAKKAAK